MKAWLGLTALGLVLVAGILFLCSDLRGWTPEDWTNPSAIVEPINKGDRPFVISACLPGTIDAYQLPNGRDYGDMTTTMKVLTCRSWSSAVEIVAGYLCLVLSYPAYRLVARWRRRSVKRQAEGKPAAAFPIVLHKETEFTGVGELIEMFVYYVNTLLRGGVASEDLPRAFLDLYALDVYEKQVRNGGHSQFIGNSGGRWKANLEHALRGAQMLGVEELAQVVSECQDWCEANPTERDGQNGWSVRAAFLDPLDERLYRMEYDDSGYAAFVAAQPATVQDWIRAATEASTFQARSKYLLAAGAWLLKQPDTQLLPYNEADAAIERILKKLARTTSK